MLLEKYLDIRGKSVINRKGILMGTIESLIIDITNKKINSLMVCSTLFFTSYYIIPLKNIKCFCDPIEYSGRIYKIKKSIIVRNKKIVLQNHMDSEIVDVCGRNLGKLIDIIFDIKSGDIKSLILSSGFFEDIFDGRNIIAVNSKTKFKRNRIIVDESSFDMKNDVYFKKFLKE